MPEGLLITGNVLDQLPQQVTKQGVFSLKNHFVAISIFVHVILSIVLFFLAEKQQPIPIKTTNKAIKSYLYKIPKKTVEIAHPVVKQRPVKETPIVDETKKQPIEINQVTDAVVMNKKQTATVLKKPKAVNIKKDSSKAETPSPKAFSSYNQLQNLRKSIQNKYIAEGIEKLQEFRSPSIMHGEQIPVPHSKKQLSPDQVREKNTTKMSDSISITKNDNGTCIIEREQFLGSPVEASTSIFSCGESKFDKSFRAHMKKVQDKLMPKQ